MLLPIVYISIINKVNPKRKFIKKLNNRAMPIIISTKGSEYENNLLNFFGIIPNCITMKLNFFKSNDFIIPPKIRTKLKKNLNTKDKKNVTSILFY